jgi:hypothetical protein
VKRLALIVLMLFLMAPAAGATIVYCDIVNGDDGTGDGSYSNPYQNISYADNGLSGGDEVRVAKTTMTALSGTLTFTEGSTSVTTSADLTSEVSAGDLIGKFDGWDEGWWYVNAVGSSSITLEQEYYGAAETTSAYKMVVPASSRQAIQGAGTSEASRLKITGGWDLTTQTRDGVTLVHYTSSSSGALYIATDYVEVAYFVAILTSYDYNDPIYMSGVDGCYLHHLQTVGDPLNGQFYCLSGTNNTFEDILVAGTDDTACFYLTNQRTTVTRAYGYGCYSTCLNDNLSFSTVTDLKCRGFGYGLGANSQKTEYIDPNFYDGAAATYVNVDYADLSLINPVIDTMSGNGIYYYSGSGKISVENATFSSITGNNYEINGSNIYINPSIYVVDSSGVNHKYWYSGVASEDTTEARSGACYKYAPTYSTSTYNYRHPIHKLGLFKVTDGSSNVTMNVYMKDDASFNGEVQLFVKNDFKKVVDYTTKTMTTSWVEQSVTVQSADIATGDYVVLWALITGTAGAVYIDDFSASN